MDWTALRSLRPVNRQAAVEAHSTERQKTLISLRERIGLVQKEAISTQDNEKRVVLAKELKTLQRKLASFSHPNRPKRGGSGVNGAKLALAKAAAKNAEPKRR